MITKNLNYSLPFKAALLIPLIYLMAQIMMKYIDVWNYGAELWDGVCLKTFFDDYIPFSSLFLIPYLIFLLFPLIWFFFAFQKNISAIEILSIYITFYWLFFTCYLVYLFFPTTADCVMIKNFDPAILTLKDYNLIKELYASSTPYNAFPSLHVAPVVFLSFFLYKKKLTKSALVFIPFAMLASWWTVALKFHVFLDLVWWVLMWCYAYYFLYKKMLAKFWN